MENSMMKRVSDILIIVLVCTTILSNYFWKKRYDTLDGKLTTIVQSNLKEAESVQERLNDLCARLTQIEKSLKEKSTSDVPFKIVDDDG